MTDEEKKHLGERALKAGVPWMVGMLTVDGAVVVGVGGGRVALYSDELMDAFGDVSRHEEGDLAEWDIVPDLTDPATLGAALVHALSQVEGAQSTEDAARELVEQLETEAKR